MTDVWSLRMRADSSWSAGTVTTAVRFRQESGWHYDLFDCTHCINSSIHASRWELPWVTSRFLLLLLSVFFLFVGHVPTEEVMQDASAVTLLQLCSVERWTSWFALYREPTCHHRLPSQGAHRKTKVPMKETCVIQCAFPFQFIAIPKCFRHFPSPSIEATRGIGRRWSALSHCRSLLHLALWAACDWSHRVESCKSDTDWNR